MTQTRVAVSLDYELATLRQAIDGARVLIDSAGDAVDDVHGERLASAVLALLESRLALLGEVVRGTVDPSMVLARHNRVTDSEASVELPGWDDEQALAHHDGEAARLRTRLEFLKRNAE